MKWRTSTKLSLLFVAIIQCSLVYAEAAWIDVRSSLEHYIDNIEGDIRISHGDIVEEVSRLYPDKDTEIYLYCRSGSRSEKAAEALKRAGYTNASNAGGIEDARKARGLAQ